MIEPADNKTARARPSDAAFWDAMYALARAYYVSHGDLDVPSNYVTPEGERLGAWLNRQRELRAGKRPGGLSEARVRLLDAIGMSWLDRSEERWNRNFRALRAYYMRYGDLDVPKDYVTSDGLRLGLFLKNLRAYRDTKYRASLTPERVALLDAMGMIWDVEAHRWQETYRAARAYYRANGHLHPAKRYVTRDGVKLGAWLAYQRAKRARGTLSADKIDQLNKIGMEWF